MGETSTIFTRRVDKLNATRRPLLRPADIKIRSSPEAAILPAALVSFAREDPNEVSIDIVAVCIHGNLAATLVHPDSASGVLDMQLAN